VQSQITYLPNAWTACIREDLSTCLLQDLLLPITVNGGADLLGARRHEKVALDRQTCIEGLLGDRSGSGHVLVAAVSTAANQRSSKLEKKGKKG